MRKFEVERWQLPTGQGGFHWSRISTAADEFNMIYDCGGATESHRRKLIEDYVPTKVNFDWLVISHLDDDHINGVSQLEDHEIKFSNVFLPHVNLPVTMFLMLVKLVAAASTTLTSNDLNSILVAGKLYAGAYGRVRIVTPRPTDAADLGAELPRLLPDDLPPVSDLIEERLGLNNEAPRMGWSHDRDVQLQDIDWKFRFFSQEWAIPWKINEIWNLPELQPLRDAIRNLALLGTNSGSTFKKGIIDALKTPVLAVDARRILAAYSISVASVKKDVSINALLKKLYAKIEDLQGYNSASLCLYAGPAAHISTRPQWFVRRHNLPALAMCDQKQRNVGWMGTGDMHLHTTGALEDFVDHYRRELPLVTTLMLPHHGSRHNYDTKRVQLRGLLNTLQGFPRPLLIAASNPAHKKFGHPHTEVKTVCKRYGEVHNVNLERKAMFYESIIASNGWCCPFCCCD
jgi:hypothetical protein